MIYKDEINTQFMAFKKTKPAEEKFEMFEDLVLMIKGALKQEEKFYRAASIPGLKTHVALHDEFARDLDSMVDQFFKDGKISLENIVRVCEYIPLWIKQHEAREDGFADCCMRINDIAVAA